MSVSLMGHKSPTGEHTLRVEVDNPYNYLDNEFSTKVLDPDFDGEWASEEVVYSMKALLYEVETLNNNIEERQNRKLDIAEKALSARPPEVEAIEAYASFEGKIELKVSVSPLQYNEAIGLLERIITSPPPEFNSGSIWSSLKTLDSTGHS